MSNNVFTDVCTLISKRMLNFAPSRLNNSYIMKRILSFLLLAVSAMSMNAISLQNNHEYYIVFNIYDKLIGSNEGGDAPALSAYGTNSDANSYIFVAEDAGNGYFLLRQKSSGKYLAASTSNTWSIVFQSSRSTADAYCWRVSGNGVEQYLQTKKNTSARVGVDGANKGSKYVSIYYDKRKGSHASFRLVPVVGADFDAAQQAYESEEFTNAQKIREIDYIQLNGRNINRSDAIDIHITDNNTPIVSGSVNLGSDRTWLIFDNIVPSKVISTYLQYVTINGAAAERGTNCRVAIYLNGAAVIPMPDAPFTGYYGTDMSGESFELEVKNHKNLEDNSNKMRSFVLRRGYMATLASGTSGSGYSRVYVADHADLIVNLPTALDLRVTSVNLKNWQYLSKKGWGNTAGTSGGPGLRATWYWSWNAGYNSTNDMEFVPCRQHKYWPSASEVNSHTSSAAFSINEPEHSEQHTSDKCSCGGTVDAWYCTTITPDFLAGGGRIGSPQPTDFSYLTSYFGHVDDMAYRCDFAVTHAYWDLGGRDASSYADWFVNQCKSIYNNTGRPVWLTEMEISASWNNNKVSSYEQNRQYLQALLERMDDCPWIERYAIYGFDMWQTYMYYEANPSKGLTPAGEVYRDHRATFAYDASYQKVSNWWAPSVKTPILTVSGTPAGGSYNFSIVNANGDMTQTVAVQRSTNGSSWQTVAELSDRSLFENSVQSISNVQISGTTEADQFRAVVTTLTGNTAESKAVTSGGLLANPNIEVADKGSVPGWTCTKNAQNGYTKATGDTYLEVWHPSASNMTFDYYQDVSGLEDGVYLLSANVFNSSNGETGASVNGEVGLYAQTTDQLYFAPITIDSELNTERLTTIDRILVSDGKLRIGIRNLGQMKARWAGADNFQLIYLGAVEDVLTDESEEDVIMRADYILTALMPDNGDGTYDATRFIVNPDANNKDTFGWTASNVAFNSGEAYDGDNANNYFDKWSASSYTSSLTQTIPVLPVGAYKLGVMVRTAEAHSITVTATTSSGASASATFSGSGDQPASASYPKWALLELDAVQVNKGESLTIKLATTGSSWWSADHFTLTCLNPVATGIEGMDNGQWTMDNGQWTMDNGANVSIIYDLSGRRVQTSILNPQSQKKGLYITNGKKILIR